MSYRTAASPMSAFRFASSLPVAPPGAGALLAGAGLATLYKWIDATAAPSIRTSRPRAT